MYIYTYTLYIAVQIVHLRFAPGHCAIEALDSLGEMNRPADARKCDQPVTLKVSMAMTKRNQVNGGTYHIQGLCKGISPQNIHGVLDNGP